MSVVRGRECCLYISRVRMSACERVSVSLCTVVHVPGSSRNSWQVAIVRPFGRRRRRTDAVCRSASHPNRSQSEATHIPRLTRALLGILHGQLPRRTRRHLYRTRTLDILQRSSRSRRTKCDDVIRSARTAAHPRDERGGREGPRGDPDTGLQAGAGQGTGRARKPRCRG